MAKVVQTHTLQIQSIAQPAEPLRDRQRCPRLPAIGFVREDVRVISKRCAATAGSYVHALAV